MTRTYEVIFAEETLIVAATEELCKRAQEIEVTQKEWARRAGFSKSHISQLLSGKKNMTLRTLARLAYALESKIKIELEWGP